jgi:hypothetical protein
MDHSVIDRDQETAGQSHQAMFERGPIRGKGAAQE